MKMVLMLSILLLLTGCKAQSNVRETVNDCIPEHTQVWSERSYDLIFGVPEGTSAVYSQDDCICYMSENEKFEINTVKLLSASIDSSVKLLSGFSSDQLEIMESYRFSLPEYRFCWCTQSDDGASVHYADIVIDDIYTYGIVCSAPEECWNSYSEHVESVFSSFGLFFDEGI